MSHAPETHSPSTIQPLSTPGGSSTAEDPRVARALEEYLAALERGEPLDRQEFLARHAEVAAPLAKCLDGLEFIQGAVPGAFPADDPEAPASPPTTEHPGAPLGDFRILREVGRGGMGVVYEAVQLSLGRRVALKVLPFAATLDATQLQRFKNEAHTAAQLQHQNIVPVYAVGCERGVHFYAMQFIDGRTLAAMIAELRHPGGPGEAAPKPDDDRTDIGPGSLADTHPQVDCATEDSIRNAAYVRSVAQLGVQAAEALEHAHQLGVVHRDIKPANLLVDVRGNLWITDFGLAQCHGQAGLTLTGDRVGTARYMSPEQTAGQRGLLDHRTDIYSLGVTLYELLTLEPACPGCDWLEVQEQILREEPRPPRQLNMSIPVDLETIVLKALAKEPEARYATAQEMANDLRRFLEDRPVQARRPTLRQRARKWARRHQAVVMTAGIAAAVLVLLAVAGLAVNNVLIRRGQEETKKAYEAEAEQRKRADTNLAAEAEQRKRADANLVQAKKAVDDFLIKVTDNPKLNTADFHALRRELLASAVPFYEEFVKQKQGDPDLEAEQSRAYGRLGFVRMHLGERAAAITNYQQARAIAAQLAEDFPSEPKYRYWQAITDNDLGLLSKDTAQFKAAEAAYGEAIAICQRLAEDFPAERAYRECLAASYNNRGALFRDSGRPEAAEAAFRAAIPIQQRLAEEFPADPEFRHGLAGSQNNLGAMLKDRGQREEAEAAFRAAIQSEQRLAEDFPAVAKYRHQLAGSHTNLGLLLSENGRRDAAVETYRAAIQVLGRLAEDYPSVPEYRHTLAGAQTNLGLLYQAMDRLAEWEQACLEALRLTQRLADDFPAVAGYRRRLADCHHNLGVMYQATGRLTEAEQAYRQALELSRRLVAEFPSVPECRFGLAYYQNSLGLCLQTIGRLADAEQAFRLSLDLTRRLVADFPSVSLFQRLQVQTLTALGKTLVQQGNYIEAAKVVTELPPPGPSDWQEHHGLAGVLADCVRLAREDTERPMKEAQRLADQYVVQARRLLQEAVRRGADQPEAQNTLARFLAAGPAAELHDAPLAVELANRAVAKAPTNGDYQNTLGMALYRAKEWQAAVAALMKSRELRPGGDSVNGFFLAMAHWQLGDKATALTWYEKGVERIGNHQSDMAELHRFRAEAAALLNLPDPEAANGTRTPPKN
jgi:serine/threonine protein kinase/Flp pilus assembly protein TadD